MRVHVSERGRVRSPVKCTGSAWDNRTPSQMNALHLQLATFLKQYPNEIYKCSPTLILHKEGITAFNCFKCPLKYERTHTHTHTQRDKFHNHSCMLCIVLPQTTPTVLSLESSKVYDHISEPSCHLYSPPEVFHQSHLLEDVVITATLAIPPLHGVTLCTTN